MNRKPHRRTRAYTRKIHGASSWHIANEVVEGWLTRDGGHLGPVYFKTPRGIIQPFSVAPWQASEVPRDAPRVLRQLRGDFFCLPFGAPSTSFRGENHPLHGETSGNRWKLVHVEQTDDTIELVASMRPVARPGTVTKRILLKAGQTVLYCSHEIEGMEGPMCLGHHAMLRLPDRRKAGHLTFSPIRFGQVRPLEENGFPLPGRRPLKAGATFRDLRRVPLASGGYVDLTRYPVRAKSDDLVLLAACSSAPLAWSAVTFPSERYLWFAVKKPTQLAATLLWYSNGGFQSPPWNGRHGPVLGIEDITAYFDLGLAASVAPNRLTRREVPTTLNLKSAVKTRIPYVIGVTEIPKAFDGVHRVRFGDSHVTFESHSGVAIKQPLDLHFLFKQTARAKS